MNKLVSFFALQLMAVFMIGCCAAPMPEAKAIVKVVDEAGKPVSDADVTIFFQYEKSIRGWDTATIMDHAIGKSNANGIFEGTGVTNENIWARAEKTGYYLSSSEPNAKLTRHPILNRWEPWPANLEVVLRKQRHPVPMYRKETDCIQPFYLPFFEKPVGYDLKTGDWVAPHGKGKTIDFFVTLSPYKNEEFMGCRCVVSFPNSLDGIQEYEHPKGDRCWYKWPFEAPEQGYENNFVMGEWKSQLRKEPPDTWKVLNSVRKKGSFIFRTRSVVDKDGKLVSACHGKFASFDFNQKAIWFTYWFNPDGTRNIEEDPKQNLFDRVKSTK